MNDEVEKFREGRKIIRRISVEEMEKVWYNNVEKYGSEYKEKYKKEDWIKLIKRPNWSPNIIWDEEEGNWIEFEDWLDFQFNK